MPERYPWYGVAFHSMKLIDILDTLSHDLKSPLVKIKSQLIIAQHTKASAEVMKDHLKQIDTLLTRMNTQLDIVFESLYLMDGETQFLYEFFDSSALLAELHDSLISRNVTIQNSIESASLLADKENIKKALILCADTLQYNNSQLPIEITVSIRKRNMIFDMRASTQSVGTIRADAGLFLAYQIITGHGGLLDQTEKPVGFRISLPLKAKKMKYSVPNGITKAAD